jgi:Protein of unknown function, DUF417
MEEVKATQTQQRNGMMNLLLNMLTKLGILKEDLDYRLLRASMVVIFLFFGYSKWFDYEAQGLIPYITHGPLISWMLPVFGIRGAGRFWEFRNGCSALSCSRDSGIRNWESLGRSVHAFRLSRPLRSSHSYRTLGQHPRADFLQ